MPIKQALVLGLAGLLSAGLYLSVLAGPAFLLLQYLTQLPLLCVGLAFGLSSLIVTVLVSVVFTAFSDPAQTIVFVLGYAGPALFIIRQSFLRRILEDGSEEWYPVGRILAGLTVYALSIFIVAFIWFSSEKGGLAGLVESSLVEMLGALSDKDPNVSAGVLREYLFFVPGLLGVSWLIMIAVNGALAQGLMSGWERIQRPRLALIDISLPHWLACLLLPSMVMLTIGSSSLAFIGGVMTLVVLTPFLFQGLGVVHKWSAGTRMPRLLLTAFYLVMVLFQWPILLLVGLGLADQWVDFRGLRS
jgi:hypothetical protein